MFKRVTSESGFIFSVTRVVKLHRIFIGNTKMLLVIFILFSLLIQSQALWGQHAWWNKQEDANTYTPRVGNQTMAIGNGAFARFANWKIGGNTSLHWDVCGFTTYDTYLTVFNSASVSSGTTNGALIFNDDNAGANGDNACGGGLSSSLTWVVSTNNTLYTELSKYGSNGVWSAPTGQSATLNYRCVAPTSLAVGTAGNGTWNTYVYDSGHGTNGSWNATYYAGYYTEGNLSFASTSRWAATATPYDASGYVGCYVPVDNHSWRAIRTNIPCGVYQLQASYDDNAQLVINGTVVFNVTCCSASANAGTFAITTGDVVEYRVSEGGGDSYGGVTFNTVSTALAGGTATYSGATAACVNYDPPLISNGGDASGGSSASVVGVSGVGAGTTTYQWQLNTADISGATSATYDPPNITTAGTYAYRRRVTDKCGNVAYSNVITIVVTAQSVIPTLNTKTPNVTEICQGQAVSATINAGSGGGTGATDTYEFSLNGGSTWAAYTSGASIATGSATGSVQVRVSRSAGTGTNCNAVGPTVIATWTVSPQAVAPTLNVKTPNVAAICQGQSVSATFNAGSGGSSGAADSYEFSINGGSTWAAYTPGNTIATGSATGSVQVRGTRSGGSGTGCNAAGPNVLATWTVSPQAVAPTINVKTPNVTEICQGQTVSATFNAGSGGSSGAADSYEFSINGGSTWASYTPGSSIATGSATGSVQVRGTRSGGSGTGCNAAGPNVLATWTVSPQVVAPTLNTKSPNTAAICLGDAVSATVNAGTGGSTGATDSYEFSINNGSTWASYTPGSSIATGSATGSVQVRATRTGGSGTGCNTAGPSVIATWNINPLPGALTPSILTTLPLCLRGTAQITVSSSVSGITYQLRDNTTNVGSPQAGNGGTLTFTTNALTATNANYNILATTGASCTTSVSVGTIAVDAIPTGYANNNDVRTCYVNTNNYVEFRSTNGIMVGINSNGQNLGNVTVTEYAGSPVNVQACNTYQPWYVTASLGRHWKIEPQFQPGSAVSIRTYFDNSDYTALQAVANVNANPNDDISALGSLDLSKYSNTVNPGVVNGTFADNCNNGGSSTVYTPAATGNISALADLGTFVGTGRYTQYSFPSFSEFWLSGTNNVSPLPIVLTSFTASCENGQVKLDWITATEINNEKFIIDRSSDLQFWEELATISGAGNSNEALSYNTTDTRPMNGLSYYRLTQKDYDGASETFEPISITCYSDGNGNSMMVYPNPVSDRYTLAINLVEDSKNTIFEILDIKGRRISIKNISLVKGTNEFSFDRENLQSGTYFIRVSSAQFSIKPIKVVVR